MTADRRHGAGSTRRRRRRVRGVDARVVMAVITRPDLWWTALAAVRRFAPPGWWRRPPWLPVPAADLWRFRMITAYGDPEARPTPTDALDYLEWCRGVAAARRSSPAAPEDFSRRLEGGDG
jgi:hypothetical protein